MTAKKGLKLPQPDTVVNTATASKTLNRTQEYIVQLCQKGMLKGQKLRGVWWIDRDSLAEYQKQQQFLSGRWAPKEAQ